MLLGAMLSILLRHDKKITSQSCDHYKESSDDESWKESGIEWEAPDNMHLGNIVSGKGKIGFHALGIGVASPDIS